MKTFQRGQRVKTRTGQIRTVLRQTGCQVWTVEESNSWYHPNNIYPVEVKR